MSCLIDTNVIVRFFDLADPRNPEIVQALDMISKTSEEAYVCAQVLIEYWVVATRPREANGLGLNISEADRNLSRIEALFPCLSEPSDIARLWREISRNHSAMGKQAHDARLVALMKAHGVEHILTLNSADFTRYTGVTPLTPAEVKAP